MSGYGEFGTVDDNIRLDLPAIARPLNWRWSVFGIAFCGASIGPPDDNFDLIWFQGPVICKVACLLIGKPGRHLLREDSIPHRFCPRTYILVGEQRHRRNLPRPV